MSSQNLTSGVPRVVRGWIDSGLGHRSLFRNEPGFIAVPEVLVKH